MPYQRPYVNDVDRIGNGARFRWQRENRHHTPPKSRMEENSREIKTKLYIHLHNPYTTVFGNWLMQENLEQLVRINGEALSENFLKDIHELIAMQDEYVYKDGIYIKK